MTTFIAYANIQQPFPFDEIPRELIPENLHTEPQGNSRITQRRQCRRLATFLLWQLLKTAGTSTALLGQIYRTQSGRPQFPVENIDFNISHSGDWVAVLLHINESEKLRSVLMLNFRKNGIFLRSWPILGHKQNKIGLLNNLTKSRLFIVVGVCVKLY